MAASVGFGFWVVLKVLSTEKSFKPKQVEALQVIMVCFLGVMTLIQVIIGGF